MLIINKLQNDKVPDFGHFPPETTQLSLRDSISEGGHKPVPPRPPASPTRVNNKSGPPALISARPSRPRSCYAYHAPSSALVIMAEPLHLVLHLCSAELSLTIIREVHIQPMVSTAEPLHLVRCGCGTTRARPGWPSGAQARRAVITVNPCRRGRRPRRHGPMPHHLPMESRSDDCVVSSLCGLYHFFGCLLNRHCTWKST